MVLLALPTSVDVALSEIVSVAMPAPFAYNCTDRSAVAVLVPVAPKLTR